MPYTKGPWKIDGTRIVSASRVHCEDCKEQLVIVNCQGAMGGDDTQADKQLMTAAPRLFEALNLAEATILRLANTESRLASVQGTVSVIHEAIAQALGKM